MRVLSIDIETFSSIDLKSAGVYKYVEAADFTILLFAYRFDNDPIQVIDLASGEELPDEIIRALYDPDVLKTAYNANFEITCLNKFLSDIYGPLDLTQWEDTMLRASYAGYSASLKTVAEMLDFGEDQQKDKAGTALINKFSKPRKPTKNDQRKRILPIDEPAAWSRFKDYNVQDVAVESAIRNALKDIEIPETEVKGWLLDQKVQNEGLRVETDLVTAALNLDKSEKSRLQKELTAITGVKNPKSGAQIKRWLSDILGYEVKSLTKETVPDLIKECKAEGQDEAARALSLRQELMKTSLAKYNKLAEMTCSDGKIHGIVQFYGSRTGRWAGRGVQVQNLPRNSLVSIETARELLIDGDLESLSLIYGSNLSDTASQLIRTVFVPDKGKAFAVADYSAIEARVIAWLSGEEWRLEVFRTTGKIYEASASQMFNVDFEKICDKNAPEHKLRAQGKVAELALGYQGSVGAIDRMDYSNAIPAEDRQRIVDQWRKKSPHIVALWNDCEEAVLGVLKAAPGAVTTVQDKLTFRREHDSVTIQLPSGRKLFYPKMRTKKSLWGKEGLEFYGVNQTTKKVLYIDTYGGKLVENVVQAIARDCLAEAMLRLDEAGFKIRFHVHDEVILEVEKETAEAELKRAIEIMCQPPEWAKDLPLNAEGFTSEFYMKD